MRARIGWTVAVLTLAVAGACTGDEDAVRPADDDRSAAAAPLEIVDETAWPMHHVDGRYRGANALGAADVDGDGHRDYVTNYEFDQRWVVALHPGGRGDVRAAWPTVEIWRPDPLAPGSGRNPESSTLGDFDGDGAIDAAGAHGFSDLDAFEGSAPGVHLVWGPGAADADDPAAWVDGGWVPATVDVGHPHWVDAHDVNGDGLTDVVVGGRRHGGGGGYDSPDSPAGNGSFTGIGWLEAPPEGVDRRDLGRWQFHRIDADEFSGHGVVFADVDGDGDDDLVDANADFDTPEDREEVAWYENPGPGTAAQRGEWRRVTLLRSPDFYAKPSVAAGDLDGDGDLDLATQTDEELLLFRNDGARPPRFAVTALPKPPEATWRSRAVRLADIDRDGDVDLVGMLIHRDGDLPAEKASVFVLLNEGRPFEASGWRLLPVKWGPGTTMVVPGFGEKWDQVDLTDVDGDGDLDIVANCEEWWVEPKGEVAPFFTDGLRTSSVAVVWFENTLADDPVVVTEEDRTITLTAMRPTVIGDSSWVERAPVRGDEGGSVAAVQAHNGLPPAGGTVPAADTAGIGFTVEADGGEYRAWARVRVPGTWSLDVAGGAADSFWLVVDEGVPVVVGDTAGGVTDEWTWVRVAAPVALAAGRHEVSWRVREHGVAVEQVVLTRDPDFEPGA